MSGDPDRTIELRPSRRRGRARPLLAAAAALLGAAGAGGVVWRYRVPPAPLPPLVQEASAVVPVAPPPGPARERVLELAPRQPPRAPDDAIAIRAADEGTILAHEPETLTVFRFTLNPAVLILDFPTLTQQARMLNRVAVFVEKAGMPHDRVLDDAALDAAIRGGGDVPDTFYYGHDYRADDLRRFFAAADRDGVAVTSDEGWLRALVVQLGWMREPRAGAAPDGALISIPRVGADPMVDTQVRAVILHHELSHGEYFTDAAYAGYARRFWLETMSAQDRTLFRAFLARDHYDTSIEDLMVNETQAYLMHTRDARFFSAETLQMSQARLDRLRGAFLVDMPQGWLRDATPSGDPIVSVRAPRRRRRRVYGLTLTRNAVALNLPPRRRTASMAFCNSVT